MTENKKCRGLLDAIEARANNESWEWERPSVSYVPGMGLGATKEATRLAFLGQLAEVVIALPKRPKRGAGQPTKQPNHTNDAKRAFVLYMTAINIRDEEKLPDDAKIETPLFQLIEIAKATFPTRELFDKPKSPNKMYESVKCGKDIFGIDKWWRGPDPESLFIIE